MCVCESLGKGLSLTSVPQGATDGGLSSLVSSTTNRGLKDLSENVDVCFWTSTLSFPKVKGLERLKVFESRNFLRTFRVV